MPDPKMDTPLQEALARFAKSVPGAHQVPTEGANGEIGDGLWVPYGHGFEIPLYFLYDGDGPFSWQMHVMCFEGRLQCVRLEAWTLDPLQPVTSERMSRFPLGRLLTDAALFASRPVDQVPRKYRLWKDVSEARDAHAAVAAHHRRIAHNGRRILTDQMLEEVARIYRAHPEKPSKAVAEHFNYTQSSARRVVREARLRGFLGPARAGRGGEQGEQPRGDGDG